MSASRPSSVASVGRFCFSSAGGGRGGRAARRAGRCPCCGLDLVGGNDNICGECLSRALGDGSWNSCMGHGDGQGAEHVHEVAGETKPKSARSGVWRPLEGLIPVGDELAPDPRGAPEEVHDETREGCTCTTRCGTRLVEVEVKILCVPEWALMVGVVLSPGPGAPLREMWGWKPLLHTHSSVGSPWCSSECRVFGVVGGGWFMGEP